MCFRRPLPVCPSTRHTCMAVCCGRTMSKCACLHAAAAPAAASAVPVVPGSAGACCHVGRTCAKESCPAGRMRAWSCVVGCTGGGVALAAARLLCCVRNTQYGAARRGAHGGIAAAPCRGYVRVCEWCGVWWCVDVVQGHRCLALGHHPAPPLCRMASRVLPNTALLVDDKRCDVLVCPFQLLVRFCPSVVVSSSTSHGSAVFIIFASSPSPSRRVLIHYIATRKHGLL